MQLSSLAGDIRLDVWWSTSLLKLSAAAAVVTCDGTCAHALTLQAVCSYPGWAGRGSLTPSTILSLEADLFLLLEGLQRLQGCHSPLDISAHWSSISLPAHVEPINPNWLVVAWQLYFQN